MFSIADLAHLNQTISVPISSIDASNNVVTSAAIQTALATKQDSITAFDGAYSSLSGKPTIPTNNNQLTNGADYVTKTGAETLTNKIIQLDSTSLNHTLMSAGSNYPLTSGAIYTIVTNINSSLLAAIAQKQDTLTYNGPSSDNGNPSTSAQIKSYLDTNYSTSAEIAANLSNNYQPVLTFNSPSANNSNPCTAYQINQHLISSYQPKNNLIYTSSNGFLGVNVTPQRAFDFGAVRVGFGNDKTVDGNQGIYWGSESFDYSIARENGAWGNNPYRKLAIRWATGIRLAVDPVGAGIMGNVAYSNTSDTRLKHNEQPITNALQTINKLRVLKYKKTASIYDAGGNLYGENHDLSDEQLKTTKYGEEIGIMAQDLQQIPELAFVVKDQGDDENGNKQPFSVNYESIHNVLIQAVQELSAKVEALAQK